MASQGRAVPADRDARGGVVQWSWGPHGRLPRVHVGDQRHGHPGVRATGPVHEHPEQARVQCDANRGYRVRRTGSRVAVRHAGRQDLPERNQTHGCRRVGTRQAAAARVVRRAVACALAVVAGVHAQERTKTVADGVYTEAQAARGASVYETSCAGCHRADLGGATGPALRAERFAREFAGKDLKSLFTKTATTMPKGAPGSLGDNVYVDVLAHLLKENGFPAGVHELSTDALDGIRVLPGRPRPLPPVGDFSYVEVVGCLSAGPQLTSLLAPADT